MASILFVCTANRFRSPIAALYFAREVVRHGDDKHISVSSAGTWAMSGYPAMPKAIELGKKFELDLSYHQSRVITAKILESSDLILVMEAGHKEAIAHEFPEAADRIMLLTEAVGETPADILDPYGDSRISPSDAAREIIELIDRGYEKITALAKLISEKRMSNF